MAAALDRRMALGALGVGSLAFLSACTGAKDSSDDSGSSSSERTSFSGEAQLEKYDTSAGTFEAATKESPAKNTPKPVKPDNANEDSIAALYANIACMAAGLQYMFYTGDTEPLKSSALDKEEISDVLGEESSVKKYGKTTWAEDVKLTITLTTDQPTKEGNEYTWPAELLYALGTYMVHIEETSTERNVSVSQVTESLQRRTGKGDIKAKYTDGAWSITGIGQMVENLNSSKKSSSQAS